MIIIKYLRYNLKKINKNLLTVYQMNFSKAKRVMQSN
jgi:hypothetical protein